MKNILIVDDDPFITEIYHDKFLEAGFAVDVAASGRRAVEMFGERTPDAMLLDLNLGDMTGVNVLEIVRTIPVSHGVPVIVLSSAHMGDLVQGAKSAGAIRCLNKGLCSPDRVVQEVMAALAVPASTPTAPAVSSPPSVAPVTHTSAAAKNWPSPLHASTRLSDEQVQSRMQRQLLDGIHLRASEARHLVQEWQAVPERFLATLPQFLHSIHVLANSATLAGLARLNRLAGALEALLREIELDSPKVGASALRTIVQATSLMGELLRQPADPLAGLIDDSAILLVDDDPISREAACASLEIARLHAISVGDSQQAIALFDDNAFDLAFLDVDMPGIDGFALCDRLHASRSNATTPVIFVTSLKDYETRLRSSRTAAVDFINKPLVLAEFAVKALIHLNRGRLLAAV